MAQRADSKLSVCGELLLRMFCPERNQKVLGGAGAKKKEGGDR